MARQAVITGLGIVSPIGVGVDAFWRAAREGRSGIGRPTLFDASGLPPECQIVGEVRDFDPRDWMPSPAYKMAGRFSQFAVAAAKMALDDARLVLASIPPERLKVAIGTSMHGVTDLGEPCHEAFLAGQDPWSWLSNEFPAHAATSHVSIVAGARGQMATLATACAAGLDAVGWATEQVRGGSARAVLAGATEAPLSQFSLKLFRSVGVLSKWGGPPERASRPFDDWRSGLVLAEGAAVVLVEDEESAIARGAAIYAQISAFASSSEGTHLRRVDQTGEAGARAMLAALETAGLSAGEIDHIAAHGSSLPDYDVAETAAIKRAFGKCAWNVPVSSVKSMCGQALAASSAIQVVAACLALKNQLIPPTINYDQPDPRCDLDYVPNKARRARLDRVLIHSHSLGGSHSAAILTHPGRL